MVGDYFKQLGNSFLSVSKTAETLITWLRSCTFVLGLLRDIQIVAGRTVPLSVIRAVLTCWMAHYLAYTRLLDLHSALLTLVEQEADRLVQGNRTTKAKALEMIGVIKDSNSWYQLEQ